MTLATSGRPVQAHRVLVSSRPTYARPRSFGGTTFVWSLVAIAAMVALLLADFGELSAALALGLSLSAVSIIWLFVVAYRETRNGFDPICISALYLFLLYPFHGFVTNGELDQIVVIGSDADRWLLYAALVQVASTPLFWLAYKSRAARRVTDMLWSPRFVIDDGASATFVKLMILWGIAMVARLGLVISGYAFHFSHLITEPNDLSGQQFIFGEIGKLPVFICAFMFAHGLRTKQRGALIAAGLMVLVEVAWGIASGSRGKLVLPLLSIVAAATYAHRALRPRTLIAGLLVFGFIVLPFASLFRTAYFGRMYEVQRDGLDLSTITDSLGEAASDDESSFDLGDGPVEELAERMHSLSSFALVMRFTPERRGYTYGASFLLLPVSVLVPSLIWPDKPRLQDFANDFRYVYWGVQPGEPTSVAPSQLGHLWSELHLVGVVLGTLLFGLVIGMLFRHLRYGTVGDTIFPKIVIASLIPTLVLAFETPLDAWLSGIPKTVLIYLGVAWFLSSRRAPKPASGRG